MKIIMEKTGELSDDNIKIRTKQVLDDNSFISVRN